MVSVDVNVVPAPSGMVNNSVVVVVVVLPSIVRVVATPGTVMVRVETERVLLSSFVLVRVACNVFVDVTIVVWVFGV